MGRNSAYALAAGLGGLAGCLLELAVGDAPIEDDRLEPSEAIVPAAGDLSPPLAEPSCQPCPRYEAAGPSCSERRALQVTERLEELRSEGYGQDIVGALPWPAAVASDGRPDVAHERADAFARDCLTVDAPYVVHCEEYPCVVAYDATMVSDDACHTAWSSFDIQARLGKESSVVVRFVAPAGLTEEEAASIRATRMRRFGQVLADVNAGVFRDDR